MSTLLDATQLLALVSSSTGCAHCAGLICLGWESVGAPLGPPLLEAVGTLADPDEVEPSYDEVHTETPQGRTNYWHPQAPIALRHFPYNRCSVWRCPQCHRGFVQYTEGGGYYVDNRVRAIDLSLVQSPPQG